jgi:uncharacterized protein (TIGR03000 family)
MLRRMVTRMKFLALAGLGMLLVAGSARAQQGWPIVGSNWDTSGGSAGGSYSSSYTGGYSDAYSPSTPSPSEYAAYYPSFRSYSPSYYAAYPSAVGSSSPYYAATSSEGYYSTSTTAASGKRSVHVNLRVPGDAKIWFGGSQTKQTGTARSFESPPLDAGQDYVYQIRVQWKQDGKDVTQTRQVTVHAGDVINLSLGSSSGTSMAQ